MPDSINHEWALIHTNVFQWRTWYRFHAYCRGIPQQSVKSLDIFLPSKQKSCSRGGSTMRDSKTALIYAVKERLNRGAFYLALLVDICLIPFALAQRIARRAPANTITVTNTNDSGPGSLRQALLDANDGDTIEFALNGTINLTSGELVIDKNVTISGPGSNSLTVRPS